MCSSALPIVVVKRAVCLRSGVRNSNWVLLKNTKGRAEMNRLSPTLTKDFKFEFWKFKKTKYITLSRFTKLTRCQYRLIKPPHRIENPKKKNRYVSWVTKGRSYSLCLVHVRGYLAKLISRVDRLISHFQLIYVFAKIKSSYCLP